MQWGTPLTLGKSSSLVCSIHAFLFKYNLRETAKLRHNKVNIPSSPNFRVFSLFPASVLSNNSSVLDKFFSTLPMRNIRLFLYKFDIFDHMNFGLIDMKLCMQWHDYYKLLWFIPKLLKKKWFS